jgi:DNA processing protein
MWVVDNQGLAPPTTAEMLSSPVLDVGKGDPGYPERLLRLGARAPLRLWFTGAPFFLPRRAVAVVGARAASGAGRTFAQALAAELARRGHVVVSGGALGIDAAAHEGALAAGGLTWAVLGCGVDVIYPDRHGPLFGRVAQQGGLLSEYPPGTPPRAGQFPARNRLIAALADAVVLVEAAGRSGALITAALAHKLAIPVLALPGSIGADRLLRAGRASPARGIDDVEDALAGRPPRSCDASPLPTPPGPLAAVVEALREQPDGAPGLARRLSIPLFEIMRHLTEAEIEGWVRRLAGGQYEVTCAH